MQCPVEKWGVGTVYRRPMGIGLTREQFDWRLYNLGSPAGPLEWFKRLPAAAGATRWALAVGKYLVLAIWASVFIWLWSAIFAVLFLYEGLGLAPWTRSAPKPAPPPATHH